MVREDESVEALQPTRSTYLLAMHMTNEIV